MISPFQNYFQFFKFKACLCHRVKLVVSILHLKGSERSVTSSFVCGGEIKKRPLNVDNPPESSLTLGEKRNHGRYKVNQRSTWIKQSMYFWCNTDKNRFFKLSKIQRDPLKLMNLHCTFFVHIFGQETLKKKRLSLNKNIHTFTQAILQNRINRKI